MTGHHEPTPEELDGIDPHVYHRRWGILATMCLSLVLIVATVSSVNVAIPFLAKSSLAPTDTQILWIIDAYALVFAAFLLPAGALGDRFGRKGALLGGLAVFAAASVASAFMTSAVALIICRAVMGIGAAFIMPSTLSLLQSSFPRRERPKAIATWAGFAGAGAAIGPVLGGALLEHYWYGAVFLVSAPIAAVAFIASAVLAPASRETTAHRLDFGGAALSVLGFAALLFAIIEGPERGWTDTLVVGGFAVAVAALTGFFAVEQRVAEPMLDLKFFRAPRFAMGCFGISITFFAMFAMFFVLTQYLQYVKGYSPFAAGIRGLPSAVTMVIVSPRAPRLVARIGLARAVPLGMLLVATGLTLLSLAERDTPYWWVALCLVVTAGGMGTVMPSLSTGIMASVPMNKAGVGSAVNDTTREVGGAIGLAVVGSVVTSIYRDHAAPALAGLPAELQAVARHNVGKAFAVAGQLQQENPQAAGVLREAVRQAFVDGMHVGLRVAAALAVAGAVVVGVRLRGVSAATDGPH